MAFQSVDNFQYLERGEDNGGSRVSGGGVVMSKELPFLIHCIEEYRMQKNLSGEEVMRLFNRYSVCEYIVQFYGALHVTGNNYIVNDIDDYIRWQQAG